MMHGQKNIRDPYYTNECHVRLFSRQVKCAYHPNFTFISVVQFRGRKHSNGIHYI